ncbi:probable protein phosphatase 2C 35 [Chenopodium quinoa]|uniref:protein-serine/threonine phosphatase n=1 Tax=Chenopodium quinoa TaxID=63459 RepID=A0A803N4R4_CHEQI|nr:probable protein phosphatase 2C 35 [Chenopodium quinoa]XP_021727737.1 probable protein phosphatase 2C 35 [Chenopodium quinoa]XP_021727738.1 probable protein phosphatase 2C 35 [Chenopodium quinoa]XP_021727739.1 probable protein phosphatase 2C 35 [Chenopodium quinoa]XP_021727740.1 probable protein phosphatase 2C 35 [Chenopodium quinoa]
MGCVYGKCCKRHHAKGKENGCLYGQSGVQGRPVFAERSLDSISVPSHNFCLEYSVLTQRGYYPDSPEKENQDCYCIRTRLCGNSNIHFFGVFDGHGQFGAQCSNFAKDRLVEILSNDSSLLKDPIKAYNDAFLRTNEELHNSDIDDAMSGTTAITALVIGNTLYVANVGDSRAVIALKKGNQIIAQDLSRDQTPFRQDEYERVKLCGARVLSVDQVEGLKDPTVQTWGDEETEGSDPPRLWVENGMYPGTAFTRSVGDSTAENIGVIAAPEVSVVQLTPDHLFFVIASDGVFEFLPSQAVVDLVSSNQDPRDACSEIVGESYKLWLTHESRTDDITIIIVHIKGLSNSNAGLTGQVSKGDAKPPSARMKNAASDLSDTTRSDLNPSERNSPSDQQPCRPIISVDQSAVTLSPSYSQPA